MNQATYAELEQDERAIVHGWIRWIAPHAQKRTLQRLAPEKLANPDEG